MDKKKITTICEKIIKFTLYSIIIGMPLFFDGRLNAMFDLTKITLMRVGTLIILGTWAIQIILTRQYKFVHAPLLNWPLGAFLIASTIATIMSVNPTISLLGAYKRYEGLTTQINYVLLFYIGCNFCLNYNLMNRVPEVQLSIKLAIGSATVVTLYGFFQLAGLDPINWAGGGIFSTFGNSDFLSPYLVMTFFLALNQFLKKPALDHNEHHPPQKKGRQKKHGSYVTKSIQDWRWLYGIICILLFIGIGLARHRGGWIGLTVGTIIFFLFLDRPTIKINTKRLRGLGIAILITIIIACLNPKTTPIPRIMGTFKIITTEDGSKKISTAGTAETRLWIWKTCLNVFRSSPIYGVGLDTLKMVYQKFEPLEMEFLEGHNVDQDRAHNGILDMATSRGTLGLLSALWFFIAFGFITLVAYRRSNHPTKGLILGFFCAWVSYLCQVFFNFAVASFTHLLWLIMGMALVCSDRIRIFSNIPETDSSISKKLRLSTTPINGIQIISIAVVVAIISGIVWLCFIPYRADLYYNRGLKAIHDKNIDKAIEMYEKAIAIYPHERYYYGEYTFTYYKKAQIVENKFPWIDKTITRIGKAIAAEPLNGYYYNILGATYALAYDAGDRTARSRAIKAYQTAYTINTIFAEPHNNLATFYIKLGRETSTEKEKQIWFNKAIEEYQKVLIILPKDVGCLLAIGKLYYELRYIKEAIESLNRAIEAGKEKLIAGPRPDEDGSPEEIIKATEMNLASAYHQIGEIYFALKQYENAVKTFKEAVRLDPKNTTARANLASAYYSSGMYQDARREFQNVLQIDPTNNYARSILQLIP